jgi:hypothetical protein
MRRVINFKGRSREREEHERERERERERKGYRWCGDDVRSSVACGGVVIISPERVVAEREGEMGMRLERGRVCTMLMFCCCCCYRERERKRKREREIGPIKFHAHLNQYISHYIIGYMCQLLFS